MSFAGAAPDDFSVAWFGAFLAESAVREITISENYYEDRPIGMIVAVRL